MLVGCAVHCIALHAELGHKTSAPNERNLFQWRLLFTAIIASSSAYSAFRNNGVTFDLIFVDRRCEISMLFYQICQHLLQFFVGSGSPQCICIHRPVMELDFGVD
jgi:hypothetical protein